MFALGNLLFACGVRSARERSFEEARSETEVGRRLLPPPLAPEPRPLSLLALTPRTRPAGTQTEPQLDPATAAGVILPETVVMLATVVATTATLSSNSCKSTIFYTILPFCRNSSPQTTCFLEKRTVTSESSR